jgi:hypothetical protein
LENKGYFVTTIISLFFKLVNEIKSRNSSNHLTARLDVEAIVKRTKILTVHRLIIDQPFVSCHVKREITMAQVLLSHLSQSIIVFELSNHGEVKRLVSVIGIKSRTKRLVSVVGNKS